MPETQTAKHTPGPWEYFEQDSWGGRAFPRERYGCVRAPKSAGGFVIVNGCAPGGRNGEARANARRIVACVNACQGIPTEALESGAVKDWLDACQEAENIVASLVESGELGNVGAEDIMPMVHSALDGLRAAIAKATKGE
ncbi:MAG: hypothetical protein ABIG68_01140 [Acidobacteriota bacterium]